MLELVLDPDGRKIRERILIKSTYLSGYGVDMFFVGWEDGLFVPVDEDPLQTFEIAVGSAGAGANVYDVTREFSYDADGNLIGETYLEVDRTVIAKITSLTIGPVEERAIVVSEPMGMSAALLAGLLGLWAIRRRSEAGQLFTALSTQEPEFGGGR